MWNAGNVLGCVREYHAVADKFVADYETVLAVGPPLPLKNSYDYLKSGLNGMLSTPQAVTTGIG